MTRWLHPSELQRPRERERFDPIAEGARYALSRELSLAIWVRVCADATDGAGRHGEDRARQRFHELSARIAARGGRLGPDVGRVTRVGAELAGDPLGTWDADELRPRVPGRETLVAVETRRWAHRVGEPGGGSSARHDLPGTGEAARALEAPQLPGRASEASPQQASSHSRMSWLSDLVPGSAAMLPGRAATSPVGLPGAVMRSAERNEIEPEVAELLARARRGGAPLDDDLRSRLEAALGARLDSVRIHTGAEADAAARALGARAFALGCDVFFRQRNLSTILRHECTLV